MVKFIGNKSYWDKNVGFKIEAILNNNFIPKAKGKTLSSNKNVGNCENDKVGLEKFKILQPIKLLDIE